MAKKFLSDTQLKSKCSFPLPAKTSFRDNKRTQDAILGWEYCEKLEPEQAAIMRQRVYRLDPPIDMSKIGERVTSIDIWEGPLGFQAADYDKFFYHKFGAGSYKVVVEEQGLSGVICDIWFTLPDRDGYPPKIDDRTLCFDKPGAKEYIDWRARRGEPVQGHEPEQISEGDDFMEIGAKPSGGSGSTAAVLVGGLVDMAQSQITRAQNDADEAKRVAHEARASGSEATPNLTMQAAGESIRLIADTSREMLKNSGAPDPVEMFKAIAGLIPAQAPQPDQKPMFEMFLSVMKQSNDTVVQMQQHTIQRLETRISEIDARAHAPGTALASNGDGMAELEKFQKMASLLGYSRGSAEAAPAKSVGETMAEWMPIINMGMQMVQTIVTAVTAPKPEPNAQPAPGVVTQQPNTQPQPAAAPPPDDSPQAQMLRFMQKLEKPFLNHLLSPDFTGFDLARHIVTDGNGGSMETPTGRSQYNQIKQNFGFRPDGTVGLDVLIQSYPPIWEIAKGDKPSYKRFLTEFFNYDEQQDPPAPKPS